MNPILSVSVPCNGPAGNSFSTSSCSLVDLQGWSTYAESVAVQVRSFLCGDSVQGMKGKGVCRGVKARKERCWDLRETERGRKGE